MTLDHSSCAAVLC